MGREQERKGAYERRRSNQRRRSSSLRSLEPVESIPSPSVTDAPRLSRGTESEEGEPDRFRLPRDFEECESTDADRLSLVTRLFENGQFADRGEVGGEGSGVVTGERESGERERNEDLLNKVRGWEVEEAVEIERGLREREAEPPSESFDSVDETESRDVCRRGIKWTERPEEVEEVADRGREELCLNADFGGET